MLKFLRDKKKDNKGFTLVELVIVVAILAILVGILAPQYTKYVEKSRKAADVSNLENLVTAFKTAASDGTTDIPAGTYKMMITTSGAKLQTGAGETATDLTTYDQLIASFAGANWKATNLKSKKWTEAPEGTGTALPEISATLVVANDGSISIDYTPTWIKQFSDTSATDNNQGGN